MIEDDQDVTYNRKRLKGVNVYREMQKESSPAITSPKIKKLAQKALDSVSMLSTAETQELSASVIAHLSPSSEESLSHLRSRLQRRGSAEKAPAKRPDPAGFRHH